MQYVIGVQAPDQTVAKQEPSVVDCRHRKLIDMFIVPSLHRDIVRETVGVWETETLKKVHTFPSKVYVSLKISPKPSIHVPRCLHPKHCVTRATVQVDVAVISSYLIVMFPGIIF